MAKHFFIIFLLFPFLSVWAQQSAQQQKDSLRVLIAETEGKDKLTAYAQLAQVYYMESRDDLKMDTLFRIYDEIDVEATKQNNLEYRGQIRVNKLGVYFNRRMFDDIVDQAPGFIDFMAKHEIWKSYYMAWRVLIYARLPMGDNEIAIQQSQQLYKEAQARKHESGMAIALFCMGKIYKEQRRYAEEEESFRQCIDLLEKDGTMPALLADTWYNLCQSLISQEKYDELPELLKSYEKANYRYEEFIGIPIPSTWANYWGVYVRLYLKTEEFDKAEIYCDKMDSISANKVMVLNARARILNSRGQYPEALELADRAMELLGNKHSSESNNNRDIRTIIFTNMGRAKEAYELSQVSKAINDSIRNVQFAQQIDELRTQYDVDRHVAEKERIRMYMFMALGGCVLLAIALGIWMYYSQMVRKKNRGLMRQIVAQDVLTAELEHEREKYHKLQLLIKPNEAQPTENEIDDETFMRLTLLMKEQRLYVDTDLSAKVLADRLGVTERSLRNCIRQNMGLGFSEYLTSLRLGYARELLAKAGDRLTIEAIAYEAGFNSRATFYRIFRSKYELTPDEFRKLTK